MTTEQEADNRVGGIFRIFGTICLFTIIALTLNIIGMAKVQNNWILVTGEVLERSSDGWWDEDQQLRYYMVYTYNANSVQYTSTQFHVQQRNIKHFTYLLDGYKTGDSIPVWYNPKKPEEAVINASVLKTPFIILVGFIGFALLSAAMIYKESKWENQVQTFDELATNTYTGHTPLPASDILSDQNDILRLKTGTSIFWGFGIPFVMLSYVGIAFMMFTLPELDSTMSIFDYTKILFGIWVIAGILSFVILKRLSSKIVINRATQLLTFTNRRFFSTSVLTYQFDELDAISLEQEHWDHRNSLKEWSMYLRPLTQQPVIFIRYAWKDLQPSSKIYLEILKKRIEALISN